MITKYAGGQVVKGGIYWSLRGGEFVSVPRPGGRLAGGLQDQYLRAPMPLVMVFGPLIGLAYVVVLPLAGLLVLVPFLASRMRYALTSGKVAAAHAAASPAGPGVSHLDSPPAGGVERGESPDGPEGRLIDLASEIAMKRWKQ